jgi:hypothetical protein
MFISYERYNITIPRWYRFREIHGLEGTDSLYPPPQKENFESIMKDAAYRIKRSMGNKLLIANDNAYPAYSPYLDGYMAENWIHNSNADGFPPGWYTEQKWVEEIERARNPANINKILILQCENDGWNRQVFEYCFASYLIAKMEGIHTYFGFEDGSAFPPYQAEYNISLGRPAGNYTKADYRGLYRRDFENGLVLVNPTDTFQFNYSPGGNFTDLLGNTISSVALDRHTAAILLLLPTAGNGTNETNQTHLACSGNSCIPVSGPGPDECHADSDCIRPNETHLECIGSTCSVVQGAGSSQCFTDNDCIIGTNQTGQENETPLVLDLSFADYAETAAKAGKLILVLKKNHTVEIEEIRPGSAKLILDGTPLEILLGASSDAILDGYNLTIYYLEKPGGNSSIAFRKQLPVPPEEPGKDVRIFYYWLAAFLVILAGILFYLKQRKNLGYSFV